MFPRQGKVEAASCSLEYANAFRHNFAPDAITFDNCNAVVFHFCFYPGRTGPSRITCCKALPAYAHQECLPACARAQLPGLLSLQATPQTQHNPETFLRLRRSSWDC